MRNLHKPMSEIYASSQRLRRELFTVTATAFVMLRGRQIRHLFLLKKTYLAIYTLRFYILVGKIEATF